MSWPCSPYDDGVGVGVRATLAAQGGGAQDWLATRDLLALFSDDPEAAAQIYAGFVAEGAQGPAGGEAAGPDAAAAGLWDRLEGQI